MTLDEAIKHAEEVAEEHTKYNRYGGFESCDKCAEEHRQIAEWLKELKDYRERIPSYEAGYNDAKREIALSGEYERAYERGKADAQPKTGHWIMKHRTHNEIKHYTGQDEMGEIHTISVLERYEADEPYCPECGKRAGDTSQNYCCACGAKMKESEVLDADSN